MNHSPAYGPHLHTNTNPAQRFSHRSALAEKRGVVLAPTHCGPPRPPALNSKRACTCHSPQAYHRRHSPHCPVIGDANNRELRRKPHWRKTQSARPGKFYRLKFAATRPKPRVPVRMHIQNAPPPTCAPRTTKGGMRLRALWMWPWRPLHARTRCFVHTSITERR